MSLSSLKQYVKLKLNQNISNEVLPCSFQSHDRRHYKWNNFEKQMKLKFLLLFITLPKNYLTLINKIIN